MSQQGDAFVRHVLKADPAPLEFGSALQYLRQREGSGRAAARALGVSESTVRRWGKGTTPKPAVRQRVLETVRGLRSRPSTMGDAGVLLPIVSHERKRPDRERDVSGVQLKLKPGTLRRAHDVWVRTGDADEAARVFMKGIGDPWYRAQLSKGLNRSQSAGGGGGGGGGAAGGGGSSDDESGDEYDLGDDYGMSIG